MRCVAKQRESAAHGPWPAAHGDHGADGVLIKFLHQFRHKRHGVGVIAAESFQRGATIADGGERRFVRARRGVERPEECAGETAVRIGKRNHHAASARPDVQRLWIHGERRVRAIRDWRDGKFLVSVCER